MSGGIERIGNAFFEVADMDRAIDFYGGALGLSLKFRDGDRWAAFDVDGTTVALAAAEDRAAPGAGATLSFKVADVEAWAREASERGLTVGPVETGPHELSVTVVDPDGHRMVVYSPLQA